MKKQISIKIDLKMLARDKNKLQQILSVMEELQNNGFIENGKIVFEEDESDKVITILDKVLE